MGCFKTLGLYQKKKTILYKERDEKKRKIFTENIKNISKDNLVYIDESGIDCFLNKSHGWAKRGELVHGTNSGKRYARESFVAAKCGTKIMAPFCYQGTCNTGLFNIWLEKILLPELKPGQLVIMDNAAFHKSLKTKELIESAGCKIMFLPPYSPDLNPIEKFWANLKEKVKNTISQFDTLQQTIDHSFKLYTWQSK